MKIYETKLKDVYEIDNQRFDDERGSFTKTFHERIFYQAGLDVDFRESYYSVSKRDVIRGMHFQTAPHDHAKLVYVTHGEILDVVLDIRENSKNYGRWYATTLSSENSKSLYISKGFAHGFLVLSETATIVYNTTTVYASEFDEGIKWDSFGFDWGVKNPIVSLRDKGHRSFLK